MLARATQLPIRWLPIVVLVVAAAALIYLLVIARRRANAGRACPACSAVNPPQASFCRRCGRKL